ncbi:MAG: hypothetical protein AAF581_15320 [Planctomycetota bacterium]
MIRQRSRAAPHRRLSCWLLYLVVTATCSPLQPLQVAAQEPTADRPEQIPPQQALAWQRQLRVGARHLPYYSPPWAEDFGPLGRVQGWLEGELPRARFGFAQILQQVAGERLLPPGFDAAAPLPLTIPSAATVLRNYVTALGPAAADLIVPRSKEAPAWPSAVEFWHPTFAEHAAVQFALAVEGANVQELQRWRRAPNAPHLAAQVDTTLRQMVAAWVAADRDSSTTATYPIDRAPIAPVPTALHRRAHYALANRHPSPRGESDGESQKGRKGAARESELTPDPTASPSGNFRPLPTNLHYPVLRGDDVILEVGSRIVCLDAGEKLALRWQLTAPTLGGATGAAPNRIAAAPVAGPNGLLAVRVSSGLPEQMILLQQDLHKAFSGSRSDAAERLDALRWNHLALLRMHDDGAPEIIATPQLDALLATRTVIAPPLFAGGSLIVVTCSGWFEVGFHAIAMDLASGAIQWQRRLGHVAPRTCSWDSRQRIRQAQLERFESSVLVTVDGGWCTRLDLATGAQLGTLIHDNLPEITPEDANTGISFHGIAMIDHSGQEQRYPAPTIRFQVADRELWALLPPRGRRVLAIDPQTMRSPWQSPVVSPETCLVGSHKGRAILLDLRTPKDATTIALHFIELTDGSSQSLALSVPTPSDLGAREPIVTGPPSLHGDALWLPTVGGLLIWHLDKLVRNPQVLPWPPKTVGGSVFPLLDGNLIAITRGSERRHSAPKRPPVHGRIELLEPRIAPS